MAMNTQDTLLAYSEWLDGEGLLKDPPEENERPLDDLASDFILDWESMDARAALAGRADPRV